MYGYLYMQLSPPQIVNQPHVLLLIHRYSYEPGSLLLAWYLLVHQVHR
jgi:hypothetical protein